MCTHFYSSFLIYHKIIKGSKLYISFILPVLVPKFILPRVLPTDRFVAQVCLWTVLARNSSNAHCRTLWPFCGPHGRPLGTSDVKDNGIRR